MKKKQIVDLITSVFLIICGSVMLLFPLFHFVKVKGIFLGVLGVYAVLNLIKFLLTSKSKDFEGLFGGFFHEAETGSGRRGTYYCLEASGSIAGGKLFRGVCSDGNS